MTYDSLLNTFGLTQLTLEGILTMAAIAVVVGYGIVLCWQYILAGIFVLSVLFVFAHHPKDAEATPVKASVKTEEIIEEKVVQKEHEQTEEEMFMEDCLRLSSRPRTCQDLWKERSEQ